MERLRNNSVSTSTTPVAVTGLSSGVTKISLVSQTVCALITGGTVDCWGYGADGEMGDGTLNSYAIPMTVPGLTNVIDVSAGSHHVCALLSGGPVYCWGDNTNGQLGNGSKNASMVPVLVQGLPANVTAVSAGNNHSCALTASGDVYCWGGNTGALSSNLNYPYYAIGQLGNNSGTDSPTPIKVKNLAGPANSVVAANNATCAVLQDGTAQCWGDNSWDQLGLGTSLSNTYLPVTVSGLSNVSSIAQGSSTGCAVLTTGALQCWGSNSSNQIVTGAPYYSLVPVEVSIP